MKTISTIQATKIPCVDTQGVGGRGSCFSGVIVTANNWAASVRVG